MKKIKFKILVALIAIIVVSLFATGALAAIMNYSSTLKSLEQTMTQSVIIAAHQVEDILDGYCRLALEIASRDEFVDVTSLNLSHYQAECTLAKERHGVVSVARTNANGVSFSDGIDVSDREYFKVAKQTGKPFVSDIIVRKDTGELNLVISAPVVKNGQFDGIVFIGLDASFLCNIVSKINIGSTGTASIIDKRGTIIANKDVSVVTSEYNTQKEALKNPKLKELADLEREVMAGNTGFGEYHHTESDKFMAYTPVPNSNGWGIYVSVAQNEFLASTWNSIWFMIGIAVAFVIVGIIVALRISSEIANPIQACAERIKTLAKGDIYSPIPEVRSKDETALLAQSTEQVVKDLSDIITDVSNVLGSISKGDLTVNPKANYMGDFVSIRNSIEQITIELNKTIFHIRDSASNVSYGSMNIAAGSQSLAQGATEQAGSLEELSESVSKMADKIKQNADNSLEVNEMVKTATESIIGSNTHMQYLMSAMNEINNKASQVSAIIRAIEDIAFQTNILALNAAVEAARAGVAGKGFAVVADEVRSLANKSSEAAKNTTDLIGNITGSIEDGVKLADVTARDLMGAVGRIKQTMELSVEIMHSSAEQSKEIDKITMSLDQISTVVQMNSATSEENAAASQELSDQAESLNGMVSKFSLIDSNENTFEPQSKELIDKYTGEFVYKGDYASNLIDKY